VAKSEKKRTAGLVLVATFTALFAVSGILIWGPILFNAFVLYMSAPELVVIFLLFGLSFIQAVVAYGLWTMQKWGRDLAKFVLGFGYILSLVSIWALEHLNGWLFGIILALITSWMLYYVLRPQTRDLFED
jgi:hypothetical protein